MRRPMQEINAGSTADIAFLLLIFFLMTSTMDSSSGLQRRLPPMPDKNRQVESAKVNRRNIMVVRINDADRLFAGGSLMDISLLKEKAKEFLTNPANDVNLPEKEDKVIEGFGSYPVSKGVISLQNTRGTSYDAYIQVQNELVKAINEIREDFAMVNYNKRYAALTDDQRRIVRDAVPQNISEAEPKDTGIKKR